MERGVLEIMRILAVLLFLPLLYSPANEDVDCVLSFAKKGREAKVITSGDPIVLICKVQNRGTSVVHFVKEWLTGRNSMHLENEKGECFLPRFATLDTGLGPMVKVLPGQDYEFRFDLSSYYEDSRASASILTNVETPGEYTFFLKYTDLSSPKMRKEYANGLLISTQSNKLKFKIAMPGDEVIDGLLTTARSKTAKEEERMEAIRRLGLLQAKKAIDPLSELALDESNEDIAFSSACALRNIGDRQTLEIAKKMLAFKSNKLKFAGAAIYERMGMKEDYAFLLKVLAERTPLDERLHPTAGRISYGVWYFSIARKVKKIGGKKVIPVLEDLLKTEKVESYRGIIRRWIKRLRNGS